MANDTGRDIATINRRLSLLVGRWGLDISEFSYSNRNGCCLTDTDGNALLDANGDEMRYTENTIESHQIDLMFGYGIDVALQSYNVTLYSVFNSHLIADMYNVHRREHSWDPDVSSIEFTSGKNRRHSLNLVLQSHCRGDDGFAVASPPFELVIEFNNLDWMNSDAIVSEDSVHPQDVPPE